MWTMTDSPVGELRLVAAGEALVGIDFLGGLPTDGAESVSVARHAARAGALPLDERCDDGPAPAGGGGPARGVLRRRAPGVRPAAGSGGDGVPAVGCGSSCGRSATARRRRTARSARRLGLTGHGARAVGLANGRNPIPVVVPCHRVVGASGSLTGYGGGIDRKQQLLDLESDRLF